MMTYFLATVLGWYLVIMGLFLLLRRTIVRAAMNDVIGQPGLLLVIAFITLLIGLMMVLSHNLWVMDWPVIITVVGWLALISGLIRLFFPELVYQIWNKMAGKPQVFTISGIVMLLIGLFLLYQVYFN